MVRPRPGPFAHRERRIAIARCRFRAFSFGYVVGMSNRSVMLRGGPFDGTRFDNPEKLDDPENEIIGLIEMESDGLINRYVPTTQVQDVDGDELAVYPRRAGSLAVVVSGPEPAAHGRHV